MIDERIEELIRAFDHFDGSYKRAEVEEALTIREGITPHLIQVLAELAADPSAYVNEDHYANVYAVALLAHFQEASAHLPIIRAFCIGSEEMDYLWGDMVTETLPTLLFQTCGGSLDAIRDLVCNREADAYVRGAAVDALTYAVARGIAEREEVIGFLAGLFTGTEAESDSYFWSSMASAIADLHPEGAMDIIEKAYADGLVFADYIGLKEIEDDLHEEKDEVLERLRRKVDLRIPADVHGYLSWFACFQEKPRRSQVKSVNTAERAFMKKKQSSRAKNKMAKKSRKKNKR